MVCEITCRAFFSDSLWYSGGLARETGQKILFLGSSRTVAAIDSRLISEVATRSLGRDIPVYNYAGARRTAIVHYFGLRNILAENPNYLRGSIILMESCHSFSAAPHHWDDSWNYEQSEEIANLLRVTDLPRFWKSDGLFNQKLFISAQVLSKSIHFANKFNHQLSANGNRLTDSLVSYLHSIIFSHENTNENEKLIRDGKGLYANPVGIRHFRANMIENVIPFSKQKLLQQKPLGNVDKLVDWDLVELVQKNGGNIIYNDLPCAEIDNMFLRSEAGQTNSDAFASELSKRGSSVSSIDFPTKEEDFPDFLHLSFEKSILYSKKLTFELIIPLLKNVRTRALSSKSP